jgi:aspartyl-tRNA(Asn)/glutamyl-tRNA(Gln) amidotransferase subunit C
MKVTDKDVTYVADLANLELTEAERPRMVRDLNSILGYIERLNQLDTSGVEPMTQVAHRSGDDGARGDILHGLRESVPHEVAIGNAPETDGTFFKVPKVIEK